MVDTLDTLVKVVKEKPKPKKLVCPTCEGVIVLRDGLLHCRNDHIFEKLIELKVKND